MKEIIAIIRPNHAGHTKDALVEIGFPAMTAEPVLGRGKQRGIAAEVSCEIEPGRLSTEEHGGLQYVPKRLISLVVPDGDVERVVGSIIAVNQTSSIGDGRVFVCPVDEALRVRTDETGEAAIL